MANVGMNISEANEYYRQGLEAVKNFYKTKDKNTLATALVNFGRANRGFKELYANPWIAIANCKILRGDLGDVDSAIRDLENAIDIEELGKRDNPQLFVSLKWALERMGEKIEDMEDFDEAHICLGKFYLTKENYTNAKKHFTKARNSKNEEIKKQANDLLEKYGLISPFD